MGDINAGHVLQQFAGQMRAAAAVIAGGSATTPAAAGKQGYAVIHISDSEELEVFEEENRDGGGSSSD
jgi:cyanophycinase-like exopeptidase